MITSPKYKGYNVRNKYESINLFTESRSKYVKKENWVVMKNDRIEPLVSEELWDKVQERMKSRARGRRMHMGVTHPLSGFLYCADCGGKLKMIQGPPTSSR